MKKQCRECGSIDVISDAYLAAHAAPPLGHVPIQYDRDPHAILFKESVTSPVRARLCRNCGAVDLFATMVEPFRAIPQSEIR